MFFSSEMLVGRSQIDAPCRDRELFKVSAINV